MKIADANVSAPLYIALRDLAARADDLLGDLARLEGERTSWEQMQAHLTRLEAYAERVSANIESLTYEEQRRTLYALDVHVTVWKPGTHCDEAGNPVRWEGELQPFGERAIRFTDAEAAAQNVDTAANRTQ